MSRSLSEMERYLTRIEECKGSDETNDWEEEFLHSIQKRVESGKPLTDSQEETLQRIEYKVEFGEDAYWEEYGDGRETY